MTRLRPRRDERGTSLVELIVAMLLLSVLGVMVMQGLTSGSELVGDVDDETRGLGDLKAVIERMSRDIRGARGVDASSTASKLTIWIDVNSDYRQTPTETITWHLKPGTSGTGQFDVWRTDGNGNGSIQGKTLVSDIAFAYAPLAPPKSQMVKVLMTYDAFPYNYTSKRTTGFEIRLRNAA